MSRVCIRFNNDCLQPYGKLERNGLPQPDSHAYQNDQPEQLFSDRVLKFTWPYLGSEVGKAHQHRLMAGRTFKNLERY